MKIQFNSFTKTIIQFEEIKKDFSDERKKKRNIKNYLKIRKPFIDTGYHVLKLDLTSFLSSSLIVCPLSEAET
jgi:hypothetical protein